MCKDKKKNSSVEVEHLRFLMYKDVLKGYNYTKIINKLKRNGYGTSIDTREYCASALDKLYHEVLQMLKLDQSKIDDMRTLFYQRYEDIYQEAMEAGDRTTALNTLNSMNKMMGLTVDKVDLTTKSVVEIKFGFNADKEEEEEENK